METSLEHADERDLIEPSLNEAAGTVEQRGRLSARTNFDPQRQCSRVQLERYTRMLLIGESRFGVSCDFKVLAVAEMSHLTTSA